MAICPKLHVFSQIAAQEKCEPIGVIEYILRDFFTTEFSHVLGTKNIFFSSNISYDEKFTIQNITEKKNDFLSQNFFLSPKSDQILQ